MNALRREEKGGERKVIPDGTFLNLRASKSGDGRYYCNRSETLTLLNCKKVRSGSCDTILDYQSRPCLVGVALDECDRKSAIGPE